MNIKRLEIVSILFLVLGGVSLAACTKADEAKEEKDPILEKAEVSKKSVEASKASPVAGPGTLKLLMSGLAVDMSEVQSGVWVENFEDIASSATKIADHPHVGPEERARITSVLGKEFGAFVAMDKVVHSGAVKLAEAAKSKSMPDTLSALAALQSGCVGCHDQFRERLTQ